MTLLYNGLFIDIGLIVDTDCGDCDESWGLEPPAITSLDDDP